MVAISLYRGKLHKVPDVPRKWLTPTPTISLKDFKILLHRRSKALARLHPTTSNPNPDHYLDPEQPQPHIHTSHANDFNHLLSLDPVPVVDDRSKEIDGGDDVQPVGPQINKPNSDNDEIKGVDLNPRFEVMITGPFIILCCSCVDFLVCD